MLLEMIGIALSTWMLMHWLEYATMRLSDGRLMRDALPFWDYLKLRTEHLQLTIEHQGGPSMGTTSDLGMLGYAHELVQLAGFLLGGFVMWRALSSHEACAPCSRYASSTTLLQRASSAVFDDILARAGIVLPSLAHHVAAAAGKYRLVGLNLSIASCPSCRRSWIRPGAVVMQGSHPVVRRAMRYDLNPVQADALRGCVTGMATGSS